MIEITQEMNHKYLKITLDSGATKDFCMKMVERNSICGLAGLGTTCINNKINYMYDISGKISLEEKFNNRQFSKKDMQYIIMFLKEVINSLNKYMLDANGLIFNPKYVFCDPKKDEWLLIYNSNAGIETKKELKQLFEFILNRLEHTEQQAVVIGYGLYKRVCQDEIGIAELFNDIDEFFRPDDETDKKQISVSVEDKIYNDVAENECMQEKEEKSQKGRYMLYAACAAGLISVVNIIIFFVNLFSILSGKANGGFLKLIVMSVLLFISIAAGYFAIKTFSTYIIDGKLINEIKSETVSIPFFMSRTKLAITNEDIDKASYRDKDAYKDVYRDTYREGHKDEVKDNGCNYIKSTDYCNESDKTQIIWEEDEKTIILSNNGLGENPYYFAKLIRINESFDNKKEMQNKSSKGYRNEYIVTESPSVIGRGETCDLIIDDEGISRNHARISKEGEVIFIKDMDSTNGTFVNDRRLSRYDVSPVREGDIIMLAGSRFRVIAGNS